MTSLAIVLKEEIRRLARKEVRQQTSSTSHAAALHRREIARLKRQTHELQKKIAFLEAQERKRLGKTEHASNIADGTRFSARSVRAQRQRTGLSADNYAKLVGVSALTIGDIHQPLHTTALFSVDQFPDGDEGGNKIPLTRGKNLHALWDNLLGRQYYMKNVDKEIAGRSNRECYGDIWNSAQQETDPIKWAAESHALCESFVYDKAILDAVRATPAGQEVEPIAVSDAYLKEAGHQARLRIIAAGIRLGVMLNSLNGSAGGDVPRTEKGNRRRITKRPL